MPNGEILTREVVIDKVVINSAGNNMMSINKLRPTHDRQCDESRSSTPDNIMAATARTWQDSKQANAATLAELLALLAKELNHLINIMEQEKQKRL